MADARTLAAIRSGNLEHIRQDHEKPMRWTPEYTSSRYATYAARNGQLGALRLLHELGYTWDLTTSASALAEGHPEVLQYLYEERAPYGISHIHHNCGEFVNTIGPLWAEGIYPEPGDLYKPAKPNE